MRSDLEGIMNDCEKPIKPNVALQRPKSPLPAFFFIAKKCDILVS